MKTSKEYIPFIEVSVVEQCNLNCAYCNSHAYLIDNSVYDFEQFKKDVNILTEHFHFGVVTFMGGEPLLCKNLNEYIEYAKEKKLGEVYRILTNGLLVKHVKPEVFKAVDVFEISRYQQMKMTKSELEEYIIPKAKEYNFRYYVKEIKYFNDIDSVSITDAEAQKGYEKCRRTDVGCSLFNGYIYKCMRPKTTNRYLEMQHGIKLENDLRVTDGVAISDENFAEKFKKYRADSKMLESCKYCLMGMDNNETMLIRMTHWAYKRPYIVRMYYKNNYLYHGYKKLKKRKTYDEGAHIKDGASCIKTYEHTVKR